MMCGSAGRALHTGLRDRLYAAPGEWTLMQCENPSCKLAWLSPMPAKEDLGRLYENYFTHEDERPAWESRAPMYRAWVMAGAAYRAAIGKTNMGQARRRAEAMYLDDLAPGHVLDVGCGDGENLARLRQRGWHTLGQEMDLGAAQRASQKRGLDVRVGDLAELRLPSASFDAVTLSHVIEHVLDPVALLAECRRLLKPGGKFVALTPNLLGFGHDVFGANWVALDPPRHLYLFGPATLAQVAQKAGFAKTHVSTNAVRSQYIGIASGDVARTGRHALGQTYTLGQLARGMAYEWRAWAALAKDPVCGDELVLEAWA